jgi:hypothetical protein
MLVERWTPRSGKFVPKQVEQLYLKTKGFLESLRQSSSSSLPSKRPFWRGGAEAALAAFTLLKKTKKGEKTNDKTKIRGRKGTFWRVGAKATRAAHPQKIAKSRSSQGRGLIEGRLQNEQLTLQKLPCREAHKGGP